MCLYMHIICMWQYRYAQITKNIYILPSLKLYVNGKIATLDPTWTSNCMVLRLTDSCIDWTSRKMNQNIFKWFQALNHDE